MSGLNLHRCLPLSTRKDFGRRERDDAHGGVGDTGEEYDRLDGVGGIRPRITNHQIQREHYKSCAEWLPSERLHDAAAHKIGLITVHE